MKSLPQPLCRFKIRPSRRARLYYDVFIWRTMKEFHTAIRPAYKDKPIRWVTECAGLVQSRRVVNISAQGREQTLPSMGQVHLVKGKLRMGYITHEMGHCAISWAQRLKLVPTDEEANARRTYRESHEERFCYALGNFARDLVLRLEKHGIR